MNHELRDYIQSTRAYGIPEEEIKTGLLHAGWSHREIEDAMTARTEDSAIVVRGVSKSFGAVRALDSVSLEVSPGTILALLGPNGAGKTTLVRILATLLRPDHGTASVAGHDVSRAAKRVRAKIGLTGQFTALDPALTGREHLRLIGRLNHLARTVADRRGRELLKRFSLEDAADRPVSTFSGGMQRRLDLACSLIGRPSVLFLDEPTTGLDPRSRLEVWNIIRNLVAEGTTVLLTTQYLDEADHLAHRITVIDHGRIIAEGTSNELKQRIGGDVLTVHLGSHDDVSRAVRELSPLSSGEVRSDATAGTVTVPVRDDHTALVRAVRALDAANIVISDISVNRPTLDDVFLALTGHGAEKSERYGQ